MLKGFIRKADIVLFVIIIVLGLASSVFVFMSSSAGDTVIVEADGKLYGKYSLSENKTVKVISDDNKGRKQNINTICIKNGEVIMKSASCHNQVCVKHNAISKTGESIICLPNRVLVKIEGKGDKEYDAISS